MVDLHIDDSGKNVEMKSIVEGLCAVVEMGDGVLIEGNVCPARRCIAFLNDQDERIEEVIGEDVFKFTGTVIPFPIKPGAVAGSDASFEVEAGAPKTSVETLEPSPAQAAALSPPRPYDASEAARLRCALSYIPADDRSIWFKAGAAIHALGWGDQGRAIWDAWSQTSVKFNAGDQDKTWAVFKPYREGGPFTTVATIYALAKAAGHREEIDLTWADVEPGYTTEEAKFDDGQLPKNDQVFVRLRTSADSGGAVANKDPPLGCGRSSDEQINASPGTETNQPDDFPPWAETPEPSVSEAAIHWADSG